MLFDTEVQNSSLKLVIDTQFIEKNKSKLAHKNTTTKTCKRLRSSRPEVFCKKGGVFINFAKFTGKHLCLSLFFADLRPETLSKKRLWHGCFPVKFAKFLRTRFLTEHVWWLLLKIDLQDGLETFGGNLQLFPANLIAE